jgi:hypothetical protein
MCLAAGFSIRSSEKSDCHVAQLRIATIGLTAAPVPYLALHAPRLLPKANKRTSPASFPSENRPGATRRPGSWHGNAALTCVTPLRQVSHPKAKDRRYSALLRHETSPGLYSVGHGRTCHLP